MFSSLSSSPFLPPETVISCVQTQRANGRHPERDAAVTSPSSSIGSCCGIRVHLPIKVSRWAVLLCNFVHIEQCVCEFKQLCAVYIWYSLTQKIIIEQRKKKCTIWVTDFFLYFCGVVKQAGVVSQKLFNKCCT